MKFSLTTIRLSSLFFALIFSSLLSACGQKGPLFLPETEAKPVHPMTPINENELADQSLNPTE